VCVCVCVVPCFRKNNHVPSPSLCFPLILFVLPLSLEAQLQMKNERLLSVDRLAQEKEDLAAQHQGLVRRVRELEAMLDAEKSAVDIARAVWDKEVRIIEKREENKGVGGGEEEEKEEKEEEEEEEEWICSFYCSPSRFIFPLPTLAHSTRNLLCWHRMKPRLVGCGTKCIEPPVIPTRMQQIARGES
jgi:hypothetical protein